MRCTAVCCSLVVLFFFFNDTATTEIYTLSLHDALPIYSPHRARLERGSSRKPRRSRPAPSSKALAPLAASGGALRAALQRDRKSTRLNSSHANISYAVFCLKKKKIQDASI